MYIYKITNILNNKCYIGQSVNYKSRWLRHKKCYYSDVGKALIKDGVSNFTFEVLFQCNACDVDLLEMYMIMYYNSYDSSCGYNKAYCKLSNEEISSAEKLLNDITSGIYELDFDNLNKVFGSDGKAVICLEDDLIFSSASECARYYGLNNSHISAVCRGTRATTGNLHFRYIDEDENIIEPVKCVKEKSCAVYVKETGLIYESISVACNELGIDYRACVSAITKCLKGQRITAKGYHWRYFENDTIVETDRTNQHEYPVIVDKNPDLVFDSISDALDYLGLSLINRGSIYQCINGRSATAFGHTWNKIDSSGYIIETGFEYSDIDRSKVKRFEIICDNKYTFKSLAEAMR